MKCKQCGTENKEGALMCSSCGYVFDTDGEMFSENEKVINAEAFHKQSQIEEIKKRRDKKRKRKKIKKIILILLIILIVAGAVFAAFYMSDKQDEKVIGGNNLKPAKNTPTPVPTETLEPLPEPTPEVTLPTQPIEEAEPERITVPTEESQTVAEATTKPVATKKPATTQKPATTAKPVATAKPAATPKPAKKATINEALAAVEKFVPDEYGNHVLATVNGKKIYIQGMSANANSYAVVSATDSGVKVNNIPVYNATSSKALDNSEFIMPETSFKLLTKEDISGLSAETLRLARNEIYARHGRTFKDNSLNEYFAQKSWYKVNPSYNYRNDVLNVTDIENKNAHFLLDAERELSAQ